MEERLVRNVCNTLLPPIIPASEEQLYKNHLHSLSIISSHSSLMCLCVCVYGYINDHIYTA